jgi:hypothetical protein
VQPTTVMQNHDEGSRQNGKVSKETVLLAASSLKGFSRVSFGGFLQLCLASWARPAAGGFRCVAMEAFPHWSRDCTRK